MVFTLAQVLNFTDQVPLPKQHIETRKLCVNEIDINNGNGSFISKTHRLLLLDMIGIDQLSRTLKPIPMILHF
jgi:hypothetical protein